MLGALKLLDVIEFWWDDSTVLKLLFLEFPKSGSSPRGTLKYRVERMPNEFSFDRLNSFAVFLLFHLLIVHGSLQHHGITWTWFYICDQCYLFWFCNQCFCCYLCNHFGQIKMSNSQNSHNFSVGRHSHHWGSETFVSPLLIGWS